MDRRSRLRVAGRGATGVGSSRPTYIFSPEGAAFATGGFPQTKLVHSSTWPDYTLGYSASVAEAAFWYVGIPTGADFNGGVMEIFSRFATAGTGTPTWRTVGWTITTRAVGSGMAWSATTGIASTITGTAVPTTACQVVRQQVTLTVSGWKAARLLQVKIARTTLATSALVTGAARPDANFGRAILRLTRDGN